jgi:hypothetical protein
VIKNAPPASTTVPATDTVPVQQKIEVDEEKDLGKDEAEPKEPGFPEEETKIQDKEEPFPKSVKEEAVVPKPGEASYLFLFFLSHPIVLVGILKRKTEISTIEISK